MPDLIRHPEALDSGFRRNDGASDNNETVNMFDLFLEHRRIKTIARLLNQMGHRTRKSAKFTDNTVERLLRDPIAKGQRRANYTQSTGDGKHWEFKPEEEWVFTEVEPVVSAELWDQVNGILEGRKNTERLPTKKPVQLFAGVTYCACGGRMAVPSNSPKYICQKCRNKIPTADLEAVFQEQIKHLFFSPEDIATYLSRADDTIKGKEELLRRLEAEEQRARREMDRVMRLYLDDKLPEEAVSRDPRTCEPRPRCAARPFQQSPHLLQRPDDAARSAPPLRARRRR
jgi:site-specific DNA recombinase